MLNHLCELKKMVCLNPKLILAVLFTTLTVHAAAGSGSETPHDLFYAMNLFSDKGEVSGRVTDAKTGDPLPGANVQVKGTTQGVITDEDGHYSLTVEDADAVLVFSFVGYLTKEETIGNRSVINVQFSTDQKLLEEVVVVGYGAQQKNLLSSSVVSMKMDDIRRNTPTTSLGNLLAGQMAGVKVSTPNGMPGKMPSISIRNGTTFYAFYTKDNSQDVLYVIDQKISSEEDFNNLSPNDVDNITVLKDAASAAAYGARAAGGVIVVTTRRGTKKQQSQCQLFLQFRN